MDTEEIMELGKVSEETKGGIGAAESLAHPFVAEEG
jgi:hypothetical protein